ncbi:hypothetical protein DFH08DRAFT_919064 [Mycena albidolilacea]|uniref:CENP-V/GFA domain-containing protein n=1 Tax=Mycena albidolilacea TaxID=1033008 RepID=A0AAD6YYF1_9AGAR|nr:hypothetical protein DFH08DRAFT_919064 [Mycena albidolilacea]
MPVELKGSFHCRAVRFSPQSSTPVPYQLCVCSSCRKFGGSGCSIEKGHEFISVYSAVMNRDIPEGSIASPELIHPFASAIDSPALHITERMVTIKPDYVRLPEAPTEVSELQVNQHDSTSVQP